MNLIIITSVKCASLALELTIRLVGIDIVLAFKHSIYKLPYKMGYSLLDDRHKGDRFSLKKEDIRGKKPLFKRGFNKLPLKQRPFVYTMA